MWRTVKISEVCEFQSGLWKGKKGPFTNANVIRNTNFRNNGNLSYENVALLEVETKELYKRQLKHGDIILEKSGGGEKTPVGRVCLFEKQDNKIPFSLSNFTCFIRVKDPSILNYKYLHKFLYYLYATGKTEPMQRNSTGIRNLQLKEYKDISIPLPTITEQKSIVDKLSTAFTEIDKSIKSIEKKIIEIEKLEEAKKLSLFNNLASSTTHLEKVANITNGFAFKSSDFQKSSGIPVIKISNVGLKEFIKTDDINLPNNFLKKYPGFIVREGDIVFALTRSVISGGLKIAKVPKIYDKALLNQRVASINTNKNLMNIDFLYHFLSSSIIRDYVLKNANTLMQPNLSISNLKKIQIPSITVKQQTEYVEVLNKISHEFVNLKKLQTKKLHELKSLKLSFINHEINNKKAA